MKKQIIAGMAAAMICVGAIGGTFAWLTSDVKEVTNTFEVGNVNIVLTETAEGSDGVKPGTAITDSQGNPTGGYAYKLFPGSTYAKAPVVTVTENSEECYVFIKVENGIKNIETSEKGKTIAEQIEANGWTPVAGHTGYYVYEDTVAQDAEDKALEVFETFTIDGTSVNNSVLSEYEKAKVKITACAIQADGFDDAAAAFAACPSEFTGITGE